MTTVSRPSRCPRSGTGTAKRGYGARPAAAGCATRSSSRTSGAEGHERMSQDVYVSAARGNPALDELEDDIDTHEGDDLDVHGELDLASTECLNQEHIGQGDCMCRDGEMDLASTNGIDQRWAHTGSRADREADGFSYDARRDVDPNDLLRAREVRQRTEAELRKRGLGERHDAENVVELVLWRR
jgi:hypothetical protein